MIHNIKLREEYVDAVYNNEKPFEVRKNDRNYQVGDYIVFEPVKYSEEDCDYTIHYDHPIKNVVYQITYILDDYWPINEAYVVFAITPRLDMDVMKVLN